MSKEDLKAGKKAYWYSNEGMLYKVFPQIQSVEGAIVAVGSDQGLDLLAATSSNRLEMVDRSFPVHAAMNSVLAVARHTFKNGVDSLARRAFFEQFEFPRLNDTRRILEELPIDVQETAMILFEAGVPVHALSDKNISYGEFMKIRSEREDQTGQPVTWYGSVESLEKVMSVDKAGGITFTTGDITDQNVLKGLKSRLNEERKGMGVIYLSNAEEFILRGGDDEDLDGLWGRIEQFPLDDRGVIIRTAQVSTHSILGRLSEDLSDPLYNIHLPWHYNTEELRHHMTMVQINPRYRVEGWRAIAQEYRKRGLSLPGISNLNVEETARHALASF